MWTNPVLWAVIVMLGLSLVRVHVVLCLIVASLVGGLLAGLPLADVTDSAGAVVREGVLTHFQQGLANGAQIALSYALLGAFAVAISHSGLPRQVTGWAVRALDRSDASTGGQSNRGMTRIKWTILLGLVVMSCASQNLIPIHIAFIPLIVPPLLAIFNRLQLDRRVVACVMTFGLVNTYMFLPYGFGDIFINQIILKNINDAGLSTQGVSIYHAMAIPALGMLIGLLTAIFITYRKPRVYQQTALDGQLHQMAQQYRADDAQSVNPHPTSQKLAKYQSLIALLAIAVAFGVQLYTDSLILGALFGFGVFMATGVVKWQDADNVFNQGIKLMAMIGFIMITAQGFAAVMTATEQIKPLVDASTQLFAGSKGMAAAMMLLIGLVVTMGIGSSFSTVPIIAVIYVPLCVAMGFSSTATVALIATAGALGDAGSPASDSTLGPTSGLNADGQHDHIWDSVVPTFLHYNIPLLVFGWIAAMVL